MPTSQGASPRSLLTPLRRQDPARIGPYLLLGRLGAGAMGRVYLGRSAAGRLVAVKVIRDDYVEEPDFRERFAHEVAAARRVSGVFTAAVVAADPEAEVPWLATAYVPAPSLARLVETCGPLPVAAVRWLTAGCAEALDSIHTAGLVHRDLKPSNVLVSLDGPQVIDFGVARAVERIELTATREALGTPAYMAPEQAREARRTGPASDIFSLGSTLLYAATGHAPYQGETTVDVLVRLATEPPDLSGLPRELIDPLAGCFARDPDARPTPAELLGRIAATMRFEDGDGARSLPAPAVALIEEYRRRPEPSEPVAGGAAGTDPEGTVGSRAGGQHPSLPPHPSLPHPRADAGRAEPGGGAHRAPVVERPHRRPDRRLLIVLACLAAIVLVGGGIEVGSRLGTAGDQPTAQQAGPPQGAPGREPPPPPSGQSDRPNGPPQVGVNQPFGDPDTTFVLYGRSWPPGTEITLRLDGKTTMPEHPVADRQGAFNYIVDQQRKLFPHGLPPGDHVLLATGGGQQADAGFQVGG